jgi:hypothetical protein
MVADLIATKVLGLKQAFVPDQGVTDAAKK